jgi:hypothetical protein
MKYPLYLSAVSISLLLSSCGMNVLKGEGNKTTATPVVSSFNAIEIDLPLKTDITMQDGSPTVELKGYENIIKHIKTKVEGNILHVYSDLDETWIMDCDDATARITLPSLVALSLDGVSNADVHGNITGNEFKLEISGAGKTTIDNINVDNFFVDLSGAASMEVKAGTVKHADYDISGVGKIRAFPLQATETSASISGAGKGEVTALQKLSASISGAGSIKYKGHPAVTQDISGAGSVSEAN